MTAIKCSDLFVNLAIDNLHDIMITNPERTRKPAEVPSPTGKLHSTDSSRQTGYSARPKKPLTAHNNASITSSSAY